MTREQFLITRVIRSFLNQESLFIEGGETADGTFGINVFQNGKFQYSKKCSCEDDVIQRFWKKVFAAEPSNKYRPDQNPEFLGWPDCIPDDNEEDLDDEEDEYPDRDEN